MKSPTPRPTPRSVIPQVAGPESETSSPAATSADIIRAFVPRPRVSHSITKPRRKGGRILPSKDHALGADDRSGVAAVLLTLLRLLKEDPDRPPISTLFTVREETGLWGARMVDLKNLRNPVMGFSYDGGRIDDFNIAAPGSDRMDVSITGIASHAGGTPEKGVSAAVIASLAIAELQNKGLHGLIREGRDRATSNIGNIKGGIFHNIVCPKVMIVAEARAYRLSTLNRVVSAYRKAFKSAAGQVKNSSGRKGSVDFKVTRLYHPFVLPKGEPVVKFMRRIVKAAGLKPAPEWSQGGLDANWLVKHGIPTVTLGAGAHGAHTTYESLDIGEFHQGVEAAWLLATSK